MISIVIASWNTRDVTAECLRRIYKFTRTPFEVILVDNGSDDGSVELFRSLNYASLKLVELPTNVGYAKANNIGIEMAEGDFVLLLNSDAFVTRNWDRTMLACQRRYSAGMVGPYTNNAKGIQRVGKRFWGLMYDPIRKTHEAEFLSFFCVLISRETIQAVGMLDTQFEIGFWEDDDYCVRAKEAGCKLMIDGRTWVWHLGSATFEANSMTLNKANWLEKNRTKFLEKWGAKFSDS